MQKKAELLATLSIIGLLCLVFVLAVVFLGKTYTFNLFLLGIASMVPIALAATGELLCERAGLFNVGIEGTMLLASLTAVWGAEAAGHWAVGILIGLITGSLIGGIFGLAVTYGQGNQLLWGLGINLFAQGTVALLLLKAFKTLTFYRVPAHLRVPQFVIGNSTLSWFSLVGLLCAIALYLIITKTRYGLRARAVGLSPFVADTLGVDPYKLRISAAIVGGMTAGIAGAYMSLDWTGLASATLIQGRGFMALACVKFGGLNPLRVFGGSLFFGILLAAGMWLQNVPLTSAIMRQGGSYLLLSLPYIIVVLALGLFPYREPLAKTIGIPYKRG
jgi:simple sugar transport system permease protein